MASLSASNQDSSSATATRNIINSEGRGIHFWTLSTTHRSTESRSSKTNQGENFAALLYAGSFLMISAHPLRPWNIPTEKPHSFRMDFTAPSSDMPSTTAVIEIMLTPRKS